MYDDKPGEEEIEEKDVEVNNYKVSKNIYYSGKCDKIVLGQKVIKFTMNGQGTRIDKTVPANEKSFTGKFENNNLKNG